MIVAHDDEGDELGQCELCGKRVPTWAMAQGGFTVCVGEDEEMELRCCDRCDARTFVSEGGDV